MTMLMDSGFAAPFRRTHDAFWRVGPVGRVLAAYAMFIAVSMLCFGVLTLLSLLP